MSKQPNFKQFLRQITHFSARQLLLMLAGNVILALGAALFTKAQLGSHPFYTMLYAGGNLFPGDIEWNFSILQPLLNVVLFVVVFLAGRKYIGLGTLVNMFLLGFMTTGFSKLMDLAHIDPTMGSNTFLVEWLGLKSFWQVFFEILATVLLSLGISLYQAGNMGTAPYDALPLIAVDHGKPFAPWRMLCDGSCLVATAALLIVGGLLHAEKGAPVTFNTVLSSVISPTVEQARIGLGTVITVFCTGPFIHFFDKTISHKLAGRSKR